MNANAYFSGRGENFIVIRNGNEINESIGLIHSEKKIIDFPLETVIEKGDWVQRKLSKEKYFIFDVKNFGGDNALLCRKAHFKSEYEYNNENKNNASPIFNVENAYGSIIGTQQSASISNSYNLDEIKKLIDQKDCTDKKELYDLIETLKSITENNNVIQKGALYRFGELLEKYSWLTGAIAQSLLGWLVGR